MALSDAVSFNRDEVGMQQFRSQPRFNQFNQIEEAEPFEPRSVGTQSTGITGVNPVVSPHTTGRMPVLLFTGPHPTTDTDRLASLAKKTAAVGPDMSFSAALQTAMNGSTNRLVVIPAGKKQRRKVARKSARRLKPRVRHMIVLLATLGVLIGTLTTLLPLSDAQGGHSLLDNFRSWIQSTGFNPQIEARVDIDLNKSPDPNHPLPPLAIPNSPYVPIAQQAAIKYGISPVYFVRQITQESHFNPDAVSPSNAVGIAQFLPSTAAGLGVDPLDPVSALNGAARLMSNYVQIYGSYAKALAAYNAGSGSLQNAENACGMNWLSCLPGETQHYVYIITGL
ncbi:MAG TPA: transglycosylase SLT domain-containing protein [Ktedonobacteraceae bacterium]|nr:transglycosylase SLT domain-containing protein [Ktedonobacteraceae bacterium]